MANVYIKTVEGGENTNPDGTDAIEIDDGTNSEYVQLNNLFDGAPSQGDTVYFNGTKWVRLTAGTSGKFLKTNGASANPAWADLSDGTPAQGDVMYHNGTKWVGLAAGTSGYFLKTQGAAANPTWAAVTAGGVGKNVLPNGGFRVPQRGAGPFTSATLFPNNDDVYLLDGCVILSDGNDIVDVSQVADTDFVSGYKIRLDVETANKRFGILLPVETRDIQTIRKSGVASLQFKVKCTGTSMSNVRASVLAWSSTADTITSDVISAWGAAGANPTLAANWTAENTAANLSISTTIATKTIENITVDTASLTNLAVLIIVDDTDATVGDYLEIGDVKLENGATATAYENPSYEDELRRCRRLFESVAMGSGQSIAAGIADTNANGLCFYNYNVQKRIAVHTFSYGSAIGDFSIRYAGSGVSVATALTMGSNGIDGATHTATATGTPLTAGQAVQLRAVNANAVLYYSAEL